MEEAVAVASSGQQASIVQLKNNHEDVKLKRRIFQYEAELSTKLSDLKVTKTINSTFLNSVKRTRIKSKSRVSNNMRHEKVCDRLFRSDSSSLNQSYYEKKANTYEMLNSTTDKVIETCQLTGISLIENGDEAEGHTNIIDDKADMLNNSIQRQSNFSIADSDKTEYKLGNKPQGHRNLLRRNSDITMNKKTTKEKKSIGNCKSVALESRIESFYDDIEKFIDSQKEEEDSKSILKSLKSKKYKSEDTSSEEEDSQ